MGRKPRKQENFKEEFCKIDEDHVEYNGYTICRNGDIISPLGKHLNKYYFAYPYSHVTLFIGGKKYKKNAAILVYKAFSQEGINYNPRKNKMMFKDGDERNVAFDNLVVIKRGDMLMNSAYSDTYRQAIIQKHEEGELSLRKLSEMYECSVTTIQKYCGKNYQSKYRRKSQKNTDSDNSLIPTDNS